MVNPLGSTNAAVCQIRCSYIRNIHLRTVTVSVRPLLKIINVKINDLKILIRKVKEQSEKMGLQLNMKKTNITTIGKKRHLYL